MIQEGELWLNNREVRRGMRRKEESNTALKESAQEVRAPRDRTPDGGTRIPVDKHRLPAEDSGHGRRTRNHLNLCLPALSRVPFRRLHLVGHAGAR